MMTKRYEYIAVTEREDDSLRANFFNDVKHFESRYGRYNWLKLNQPKDKISALLEASKSESFSEHEREFLTYESLNFGTPDKDKKRFYRVWKTKQEKVNEVLSNVYRLPNSVFDVTKY